MGEEAFGFGNGGWFKKKRIEELTTEIESQTELLLAQEERQQTLELELEQQKLRCEELQNRPDPEVTRQQQAELEQRIDDAKQKGDQANQELEVAQRTIRELTETNDSLSSQVSNLQMDLKQKDEELKSQTSELLEQANLGRIVAVQKNDVLSLQQSLASSTEASNAQIAELKSLLEKRDLRIQELESSSLNPPTSPIGTPPDSELSNNALSKIEEVLRQQSDRMATLEQINQKSLEKIEQIQVTPPRRSVKRVSLPEGHEDLSKIQGVGPKFRQKLFDLGVKTISQISLWTEAEQQEFAEKIGCGERTIRQWVDRAKQISSN